MNGNKPVYKGARDLPIYTAIYKLLEVIDDIFDTFKRDRKHTLGQKLYNTVLEMFECIRVANDFPDEREKALITLLGKYDNVHTMLKLSSERAYITKNQYLSLFKPMSSIERQALGWLKSTKNNAGVDTIEIIESAS